MGKVGTSVYENLKSSSNIIGFDSDDECVKAHKEKARNVVLTDAESPNFWSDLKLNNIDACVLCLASPEAKKIAIRKLREAGYEGIINAYLLHEDEASEIIDAGANFTYLAMEETGKGLAVHTIERISMKTKCYSIFEFCGIIKAW